MFLYVRRHRDIYIPIRVIPREGDTTVERTFRIYLYLIVLLQYREQMFGMLFPDVFDTKIVHCKGEPYWSSLVLEQARGMWELSISVRSKALF